MARPVAMGTDELLRHQLGLSMRELVVCFSSPHSRAGSEARNHSRGGSEMWTATLNARVAGQAACGSRRFVVSSYERGALDVRVGCRFLVAALPGREWSEDNHSRGGPEKRG